MRRTDIMTSSTRLISWTLQLRKDLSREISALHIKEPDHAFTATNKGMFEACPVGADDRRCVSCHAGETERATTTKTLKKISRLKRKTSACSNKNRTLV